MKIMIMNMREVPPNCETNFPV